MQPQRHDEWQEIEHLSEAMLDAARHDRWDDVIEIESLRRGLLEAFFAQPAEPAEVAELEAGIRHILELDREVMNLGREEQTRIGNELSSLQVGRRAAAAYSQNS